MRAPYFQVDAFTDRLFSGNPAGVCLLEAWTDDDVLQHIAFENGLSETAFLVPRGPDFDLRWFTPVMEVDLCGHATLASAHVLANHRGGNPPFRFHSRSGLLTVSSREGLLELDFPAWPIEPVSPPPALIQGLGGNPTEVFLTHDYLAVFSSADEVREITPDFAVLDRLECRGICVTAPGKDCDFVSRFFAPRAGIPEDPVTGSVHCALAPFWAARLGRNRLKARQISSRGGTLRCEVDGDRVKIAGRAITYLEGSIAIPA